MLTLTKVLSYGPKLLGILPNCDDTQYFFLYFVGFSKNTLHTGIIWGHSSHPSTWQAAFSFIAKVHGLQYAKWNVN